MRQKYSLEAWSKLIKMICATLPDSCSGEGLLKNIIDGLNNVIKELEIKLLDLIREFSLYVIVGVCKPNKCNFVCF